jgi:ribose transport system substrate-binding protein
MALTIFQDAKGQATGAVKVTKALLDKQKVQVYNWTPYKTITPENHSQFAAQ